VNAQREGWQDPHVNVYATYGQGVNVEKDSTMYERQKKELELQEGREVARNKLLKATNLDQYCDDVRNLTDETCKKYWQTKEPDGRFKQWYPTDWEKFDKERLRGNTAVLCAAYPKESECCPYFKANNQANYQLYCSAQYIAGRCDELAKTGLQNLCVAGGCPNDSRCCPWYENQKDAASLASYCPGFSPGKTDPDAELDPSSGRRIKIPLKL
ncbi:MAG: hypothetical protein LBL46_02940, partial [Rickettsiales bacterium]|nr:hypothetical protein [Rickettsiales bacterium]